MDTKKFEKPEYYVNRELSWLKFNERVLSEARDKSLPVFQIFLYPFCNILPGFCIRFPAPFILFSFF